MGIIHEELEYDGQQEVEVCLDEAYGDYDREGRNISLEVNSFDQFSGEELVELGKWLIEAGKYLDDNYDEYGKPKGSDDKETR